MNSSFHAVIANLNTSLRNPVDRGDGEQPHCYVRADELAALIQCAAYANDAPGYVPNCVRALEACDRG